MAVLYTVPQVVDADGGVVTVTAKFFKSGTATAQNVYSDNALSTSLGNTINADSVGRFTGVYLQNKNYRVTVYVDAVELYSQDNIDGISGDSGVNIDTFAALRLYDGTDNSATVNGHTTVNDDGGGTFITDGTTGHAGGEDDNGINIVGTDGRLWVRQFKGGVSTKYFGALIDGTTDDTTAVQATFTYAMANGRAPYVPSSSAYHRMTALITGANSGVTIYGDGFGVSRLVWDSGSGIKITQNSSDFPTMLIGVSLETKETSTSNTDVAFELDCSGQIDTGVIVNRTSPRFYSSGVWAKGFVDVLVDGWDTGLKLTSCLHASIEGFHFEGRINATEPNYTSNYGIRVLGSGAPVEFKIQNSWIYYAVNGIHASGVEGIQCYNNEIIACTNGIVGVDTTGRPHLIVKGGHINATSACVIADNMNQVTITDATLYASIVATATVTGVIINSDCDRVIITDNQFENTNGTEDFNAIQVNDGNYGVIDGNVFTSATIAIVLTSGATNFKVGRNNIYTGVTTKFVDNGTNNSIATSTVTAAGTTTNADGLIQKWGTNVVTLDASGNGTITYPTAFPNAFFIGVTSGGDAGYAPGHNLVNQGTSSKTVLGVSVRPNPGAVGVRFNWLATGN